MFNFLDDNNEYKELKLALEENPRSVSVHNICDNAKVFFVSTFAKVQKLVVLASEEEALSFFDAYKFYDDNVLYYTERDLLFEKNDESKEIIDKNRINILTKLSNKEKITVVATITGLLEKIPKMDMLLQNTIKINTNDNISVFIKKDIDVLRNDDNNESELYISCEEFSLFDKFVRQLIEIGYTRVDEVEKEGEMAVHGGIIDIYDVSYDNPIRLEFMGDDVDSIRYFDLETKRTIEIIGDITINPHSFNKNDVLKINDSCLLDYFLDDRIVFIDEPKRLQDRVKMIYDMLAEAYNQKKLENDDNVEDDKIDYDLYGKEYIFDLLSEKRCIQFSNFDDAPYICSAYRNNDTMWDKTFDIVTYTPVYNKKEYNETLLGIKKLVENGYRGEIILNSYTRAERFAKELVDIGINAFYSKNVNINVDKKNVVVLVGNLKSGFVSDDENFFVFTEKDLWGIEIERNSKIKKAKKKISDGFEEISDISKLSIGDYIVHETFGIGIFKGIKRLTSGGVTKDYVSLEYADGGNLYVLVSKLEVIQKYASKNADVPKLNKLNNNDFVKTKLKAKEEVFAMAEDLIKLYASRMNQKGHEYKKDTFWQKEFEETFPYIETVDQLKAIEEVKKDMESNKTMDRLICGDVGFGKTEVAIRASFKALQDSKQVAYLVPTTVLCMQHYKTFSERFKEYPINIDYLSRFKSSIENKKTIEKMKNGKVDIVIGTHRLLSNDVLFKDLGLLIIDEEQRFGVGHKEKIKKLKNNVDVLTLSATPIPRTLYMSLSGIRDISVMTEAPKERMPIKTYVLEYNDELIREAIDRELKRDGQVFIVHNKVMDIYQFAEKISKIVPNAKIGVAHGQLNEKDLSEVMMDFIDKKTNVLVSTTIIETGIDIQNANTLIVDDADHFGMSQLYQLRGRVGRSNRTAYAFLFYKKDKILTETSEKRLKAIKEFTSLGSGIKIAMRDLEIRGAGNVLGMSQSGHIEAIGYELYCKYLNNAIKLIHQNSDVDINNIKEDFVEGFDTTVDVDINAFIPKNYIGSDESKLDIYRKISKAEREEEFDEIEEELKDRFGDVPIELINLIKIAKLKIKAKSVYITDLTVKPNYLRMVFFEKAKIDPNILFKIIDEFCGVLHFSNDGAPTVTYREEKKEKHSIDKVIKMANYIIDKLK